MMLTFCGYTENNNITKYNLCHMWKKIGVYNSLGWVIAKTLVRLPP